MISPDDSTKAIAEAIYRVYMRPGTRIIDELNDDRLEAEYMNLCVSYNKLVDEVLDGTPEKSAIAISALKSNVFFRAKLFLQYFDDIKTHGELKNWILNMGKPYERF